MNPTLEQTTKPVLNAKLIRVSENRQNRDLCVRQIKFKAKPEAKAKWAMLRALRKEADDLQFDIKQDFAWKNRVAGDLNTLVDHVKYNLVVLSEQTAIDYARAALRIVKRVSEFEGIRRAK